MIPPPIFAGDEIFVLSLGQQEELSALIARAGWRVLADRRGDGAASRFLSSGARLAVLDARGAVNEVRSPARAMGDAARAKGGALIVLVTEPDIGELADFLAAGATHFLVAPFSEEEFAQSLRFAWRHVERMMNPGGATEFSPAGDVRNGPTGGPQREGEPSVHGPIGERDFATGMSAESDRAMTSGRNVEAVRDWIGHRLAHGEPVSAIMIALSRFDLVNSTYGRIAGDMLIRAARKRVEATAHRMVGPGQVVGRMSGPEFLIGVAGPDDAARLGSALAEALARPFAIDGGLVSVGARVGIATAQGGETLEVLLREANAALEGARLSDGGAMRIAPQGGLIDGLAGELRRAIERDEITVLFQPQVAIGSERIVGVEALARWDHAELGALGAEILLAAADRADLGLALSDHIQCVALNRAVRWPETLARLRLSINLTAADIARQGFADILLDRIDGAGFPRSRLTVEITESGLIDDLSAASTLLAQLRQAGCRVAIDDFGTGYSSLAYLKALPLDYLKIDRQLAQDIAGSTRDRVVVRGVIEMARSLGLAVIAEGVETTEQLNLLAKEGCQYYQGFLCAGPLTSEALAALVAG